MGSVGRGGRGFAGLDDDDEDTLVVYGTPIEVPEDDEEPKRAVPVQDQVVTDKQGRRRFHGAFTGGFSAGYFNTVGTKEGQRPTQATPCCCVCASVCVRARMRTLLCASSSSNSFVFLM